MKQVKILTRYELKNTGGVIYHLENGEQRRYYTGLYTNGDTTCTCKHGENAGTHAHCYHVAECQVREAGRAAIVKAAAAQLAARQQEEATAMAELAQEILQEAAAQVVPVAQRGRLNGRRDNPDREFRLMR